MPKRLENLREHILSSARGTLLTRGYSALTIRGVAADCGIAVGTVYNYYPSKEMLAAGAILKDWFDVLDKIARDCDGAAGLREGLGAAGRRVALFEETYRTVWSGSSARGTMPEDFSKRRRMLVRQLADRLHPMLLRFAPAAPPYADIFLAENLLICAGGSDLQLEDFLDLALRAPGFEEKNTTEQTGGSDHVQL